MKALFIIVPILIGIGIYFLLRQSEESSRTPLQVGIPKEGRLEKSEAEWKAILSPEAFYVTREKGTERAFTGAFWKTKDKGIYRCICCDQPLFESSTKFDSGTGWPSFWEPIDVNAVSLFTDGFGIMQRVEVECSRCDAHLGHVFNDGPAPTGKRYCMNSEALKFVPSEAGTVSKDHTKK